ncbi:hypothetical protein WA026_017217 [Henosepilachna vigintioctopunctata]|uniref:SHSP domain-containing protein n=1 Tax=Henosepilachna vigintioctopunctata TaxID=420089 RepID=A0AAW1UKD4_9CUCU
MSISPWIDNYRHSFGVRPKRPPIPEFTYDPDDFRYLQFGGSPPKQWSSSDENFNITSNNEEVIFSKDEFRVIIDVQEFSPEELTLKTSGNMVTIDAKYKKKEGYQGFVSRHFKRLITIPKYYDIGRIKYQISPKGILTIIAPKINNDGVRDQKTKEIEQTSQTVTQADQGEQEKCPISKL